MHNQIPDTDCHGFGNTFQNSNSFRKGVNVLYDDFLLLYGIQMSETAFDYGNRGNDRSVFQILKL